MNISCTSTGGPVPTITWTLNDQPTSFSQTDIIINDNNTMSPGKIVSTLHISNIKFPTHEGVYICNGSNIVSGFVSTSSVSIFLQVIGMLTDIFSTSRPLILFFRPL